MENDSKVCCTCKIVKPFAAFAKCRCLKDGFQKRCRECQKISAASWRKRHPHKRQIHFGGKPGLHNGFKPNPRTAPTEHPTSKDICWAAGLYEGEGSVEKSPQCSKGRGLKASIGQKDAWVLYRLKALFGGSVTPPSKSTVCSHWRLSGPRGHGFLMTIYSLLSPRRQEQLRMAWA